MKLISALMTVALLAIPAHALETPEDGYTDARIKSVAFREGEVVRIATNYARETMIVLHPSEEVEYIGAGNKQAWTFGREGNLLTLKPISLTTPTTNMNLVVYNQETGKTRYYSFLLDVVDSQEIATWRLQFRYPDEEAALLATKAKRQKELDAVNVSNPGWTRAEDWNETYGYYGDDALAPISAKDNGVFTYFKFSGENRVPSLYAVNPDGTHNAVNHHMEGDYVVVKRLADEFVLRMGDLVTYVRRMED